VVGLGLLGGEGKNQSVAADHRPVARLEGAAIYGIGHCSVGTGGVLGLAGEKLGAIAEGSQFCGEALAGRDFAVVPEVVFMGKACGRRRVPPPHWVAWFHTAIIQQQLSMVPGASTLGVIVTVKGETHRDNDASGQKYPKFTNRGKRVEFWFKLEKKGV